MFPHESSSGVPKPRTEIQNNRRVTKKICLAVALVGVIMVGSVGVSTNERAGRDLDSTQEYLKDGGVLKLGGDGKELKKEMTEETKQHRECVKKLERMFASGLVLDSDTAKTVLSASTLKKMNDIGFDLKGPHKEILMKSEALLVYEGNAVVSVDLESCRVMNLYEPTRDGKIDFRVRELLKLHLTAKGDSSQNCRDRCSTTGAISSGLYTGGGTFTGCKTNAENQGNRPGWNLVGLNSAYNSKCYVGVNGIGKGYDAFECICSELEKTYTWVTPSNPVNGCAHACTAGGAGVAVSSGGFVSGGQFYVCKAEDPVAGDGLRVGFNLNMNAYYTKMCVITGRHLELHVPSYQCLCVR